VDEDEGEGAPGGGLVAGELDEAGGGGGLIEGLTRGVGGPGEGGGGDRGEGDEGRKKLPSKAIYHGGHLKTTADVRFQFFKRNSCTVRRSLTGVGIERK
jgi:hypothetical protein